MLTYLFRLHPTRGLPHDVSGRKDGGKRQQRERNGRNRRGEAAQQRLGGPRPQGAYLLPKGLRFHARPLLSFWFYGSSFQFQWTHHLLHGHAWETVPVVKDGGLRVSVLGVSGRHLSTGK